MQVAVPVEFVGINHDFPMLLLLAGVAASTLTMQEFPPFCFSCCGKCILELHLIRGN